MVYVLAQTCKKYWRATNFGGILGISQILGACARAPPKSTLVGVCLRSLNMCDEKGAEIIY